MNSLLLSLLAFNIFIIINALPKPNRRPTENAQLFQGDMKFEPSQFFGKTLSTSNNRLWPNGIVPYVISSEFTSSEVALIEESMRMIESRTERCITFRRQVSSDTNWISIVNKVGCWSFVGRNTFPSSQEVSIQKGGCMYKGTIVHEFLHAMGFWHEQSRADRDSFVRITYNNIMDGYAYAFDREDNSQTFNLPYDLNSIMHYDNNAFSKNGQPTIVAINGQRLLATYEKSDAQILSPLDVQAIRAFYSCSSTNVVTNVVNATSATVGPTNGAINATAVSPIIIIPTNATVRPATTMGIIQPFTFTIINRLRFTVRLYWVNFQGQNILYATLARNTQLTQGTYPSHVWLLSSDDTRYNRRFTIGSDPAFMNTNTVFIAQ